MCVCTCVRVCGKCQTCGVRGVCVSDIDPCTRVCGVCRVRGARV